MSRYMSVLLGMAFIQALFLLLIADPFSGFYRFWLTVTIFALIIVPVFHFVGCANGHARSLLFTNESYLMLTLPVHSRNILIGRILAGLAEFTLASTFSGILILVIGIWCGLLNTDESFRFLSVQRSIFFMFVKNFRAVGAIMLLVLNSFFFIGTLTLFAQMTVRSFTVKHRKGLIIVAAILVFTAFVFLLGKVEALSTDLFHGGITVPIYSYAQIYSAQSLTLNAVTQMWIPLASSITALIFSVALFFASAYLLEHRVEV